MRETNLDCCVVRDLLPSYLEELTETETSAKPLVHALQQHLLEKSAKQASLAKPSASVLRDRGMVGYRIVQIQSQKPPISHIYTDLLFEPSFRFDSIQKANEQVFYQNNWINAWSAGLFAVTASGVVLDKRKVYMPLQLTQKMIFRYKIFDRDRVKPELLTFCPCQHIRPTLSFLLFYHAV